MVHTVGMSNTHQLRTRRSTRPDDIEEKAEFGGPQVWEIVDNNGTVYGRCWNDPDSYSTYNKWELRIKFNDYDRAIRHNAPTRRDCIAIARKLWNI